MQLTNTTRRFGLVSILNHWLTAALVIALIGIGWIMEDMERGPELAWMMGLHKSLGILVLCLALLRVFWRRHSPAPAPVGQGPRWQQRLAVATHILLVAAILAMPLSGWLMSSAGGHPVAFFGLFELPAPWGENETLSGIGHWVHGFGANLLVAVLLLHVAGALKHHFLDRDHTLRRMVDLGDDEPEATLELPREPSA